MRRSCARVSAILPGAVENSMRKKTVRLGLNLMVAAISLVTLATFFHGFVATILFFPAGLEARFVYLALAWGGAIGCCGVIIAASGFLREERTQRPRVRLIPSVVVLAAVIILFFVLLLSSFRESYHPGLRPGETVII